MTALNANPDFLAVYDTAIAGLAGQPDDVKLAHTAVLALARSGATQFAAQEFKRLGLDRVTDDEDVLSLTARLAKDRALQQTDPAAISEGLKQAAELYGKAFASTGGSYSQINWLTLESLSGQKGERWRAGVEALIDAIEAQEPVTPTQAYYREATKAEAYLLLNQTALAASHLHKAFSHDPLNYPAHASTLRQFRLIEANAGRSDDWLTPLSPPGSVYVCGHIFSKLPALPVGGVPVETQICDMLQGYDLAFGFGALAAGSDIELAEAILSEGGQFCAVLPVDIDRFEASSVAPAGEDMQRRFRACLDRAHDILIAFPDAPWPSRRVNELTARIAMGKARLHAGVLQSPVYQLALADPADVQSETRNHIRDWSQTGGKTLTIDLKRSKSGEWTDPHETLRPSFTLFDRGGPLASSMQTVSALAISALDRIDGGDGQNGLSVMQTSHTPDMFLPRTLVVEENVAALLAFETPDSFIITHVGRDQSARRMFVVSRARSSNL